MLIRTKYASSLSVIIRSLHLAHAMSLCTGIQNTEHTHFYILINNVLKIKTHLTSTLSHAVMTKSYSNTMYWKLVKYL